MFKHSFSIIGLGKVGTSLLQTLLNGRNELIGISTKNEPFGKEVASEYNCIFESTPENILRADIIIIAVNDASIKEIGQKIMNKAKGVIAHTSGALSSNIFSPYNGRVSIHPVFPVYERFMNLIGKTFSIEGDEKGLNIVREILDSIDAHYFIITSEKKPLYHLASVIGSNFINSLAWFCSEVYRMSGINEKVSIEIIEETISAVKKKGMYGALTGPVERGDMDTVRMDIDALKDYPELKKIVIPLFELTLKLAKKKGIEDEKISRIMGLITSYNIL